MRRTSTVAHPQPTSSVSTCSTVPASTIVSPGNTDPFIRNFMRPSRPYGPDQSVRYRSNHAAWFGVFKKMSRVPLRFTAKSWSWCIGHVSRLAMAPSTTVVAVTS